jgi:hypothetical protein
MTVSVEHWHEGLGIDAAVRDGSLGGFLAGSWLAGRGHRAVGWVSPRSPTRLGSERW